MLRLISLLPVFFIFITLPLNVHYILLVGPTTFVLVWLGNFKLLLFSFNLGPLSTHPPPSFFHFICIACLPIQIKQNSHQNSDFHPKSGYSAGQTKNPFDQIVKDKPPNRSGCSCPKGINIIASAAIIHVCDVQYDEQLHPYVTFVLNCCYVYLGLKIIFALTVAFGRATLASELEPQFKEPHHATSLQDFWGRRWNLPVTGILRQIVYNPLQSAAKGKVGPRWARRAAVMSTFAVSGLMHEILYYYLTRVGPTWEVTWFFLLQGACVVVEVEVKKQIGGSWRLQPMVSRTLVVVLLAVTSNWLFFPQLLRNEVFQKSRREYGIIVNYLKKNGGN